MPMPKATVATTTSQRSRGERLLGGLALLRRHAGVVGDDVDAALLQRRRQVVHVAAAQAVDDAGLAVVAVEDFADLFQQVVARQHAVGQVGPVEVADQDDGVAQGELGDDVAADLFGGGGGVGMDGGVGEELAEAGQHAIFGAEIVAPVADAVGLVDGEGVDADLLQHAVEVGLHQPFGRDEQQADVALAQVDLGGEAVGCRRGSCRSGRRRRRRREGHPPGPSSGRSAARRRRWCRRAARPEPGSRATCRRRWAGRRANPGRRGRPAWPVPAAAAATGSPNGVRQRP